MRDIFLTLSTLFVFVAYAEYIWAIFKGKAKPHRTTRFVIFLITVISTVSLVAQGSQNTVWLFYLFSFFGGLLFFLSLKFGMGGWSKLDIACLILALGGILVWKLSNNPVYALYASILADIFGFVPTLVKTYKRPETESWRFFAIGGIGVVFNLLALETWSFNEAIYPLYLVVANFGIVILILRGNTLTRKNAETLK